MSPNPGRLPATDHPRRDAQPTAPADAPPDSHARQRLHLPSPRLAAGQTPRAPALPLPHERDEAPGATRSVPQPAIDQAARDLGRGLVDTDERGKAKDVFERSPPAAEPPRTQPARPPIRNDRVPR